MKIFTQVNKSLFTLLTMVILLMVGSTNAWGECTLISGGSGSVKTSNSGTNVYSCSFTNTDGDALTISYTCTIGTTAGKYVITNYGSNVKVEGYYNNDWHEITTLSYGQSNQNQARSHTLTGDAKKLTQVRFKTTDGTWGSYDYSISNFKIVREGSLKVSLSAKDLGNTNIGATSSQKFTISAYNLNGTPTANFVSGADAAFSKSSVTYKNNDCPKQWEVTVSYKPTCANTSTYTQKTCTLRVSLDGKTKDIVVKATPTLNAQTVNWELGNATSLVAGTSLDVAGFATSTSDIDGKPAIYYTSSDESVIDVDEDGHTLIANGEKAGFSATITAHQDADCKCGSATADQVFTVTAKDRPEFTLYVGGVATEATSANLKVGDVVEIHYANAPNLQVSGGSSTTFTHTKNTTDKIVTVTATGVCTNGELTLSESGNTLVEKRTVKFTFNITKHETSLSSLMNVNDFYVGNSAYAATAYNFANGTAYNTNNSEVDVHFSSTDENVINLVNGQIKALKAGTATITISQTANNKWTGASVQQTITVKKRPAVFTWNVGANYTWNQAISNPFTTNNSATEITCVSDNKNVADYVDGKVVIYNVNGTAHFTLSQAENDVWKETSQQYTVTVAKPNNHVTFTYGGSFSPYKGETTDIIEFEGVPSNVTFNVSSEASADKYYYVYQADSPTGNFTQVGGQHTNASSITQELKASTRAIYFKFDGAGGIGGMASWRTGTFSNITVNERREVKPSGSADVDCGTANHGENPTEVKAILEWYNVKPLTCWITSDHPEAFELVTTSINSQLDTYKKNEEITVRGKHDVPAGTYTGTLHVSNGIESTTFNLTTTTTKQTPSIKWKNNLSPLSVGDVVTDAAGAGSAPIHYTVDGTYLTLNEQGAVVAENATDENGVDLIAYVIEDETWIAKSETIKVVVTNLEKQTITWNDKLSVKFTGTKEIDLTATASSGLPIKYELSGTGSYAHLNADSSKLVITAIGNTLYLTARSVDHEDYFPAARTKNINSRDPNATCPSEILYEEYNEQKLTTEINSFGGEWVELTWDAEHPGAEPGLLSCQIKAGLFAVGKMAIEEYVNGQWKRVGEEDGYEVDLTYKTISNLAISRNATKVRIGAPEGCTLNHYVDEIKLTQAKYCELSKSKLDFGTVTMGTAPEMSFTVHYSNLAKSLDIELENAGTQFTVDKAYIGDDCGEHGTVTVTVTYNADNYVASESTNLVISNTEYNKKVSLTATVQKASQTITWNPNLSLNTTDVVAFDAVTTDAAAATGVIVKYAVTAGSDVATVTEDGQLTIIKNGTVKVKAYAEGNSQYEDATDVEKTFTISKVTPTITKNPTINAITLPATLNDVAIGLDATAKDDKNNTVTGSFAWQTSSTKVLSGANDYVIVFTPNQPTDRDWYNEVVYNISVTGNKGDQSITWTRADETTQPCSTPTTFDASSNRGLAITYESDDESIARVDKVGNEYHLVVLTGGTVHITAKQPGNGDYNAAEDVTKTITLTREQPVITTPPTADEIFTDNHLSDAGLSGGEGKVNGVHADGIFAWKNGDIQPEYGTHSYTATFTPSPAAWYFPAECQVSVTVNKHPHSLSWDYAGGTISVDKNDLYFGGATSSVELDNIYYTTSNAAVAEVDAELGNKLIIHGKGTIEVIARSEGNTNYYAAEQRRTLTINPLATTVNAAPTAEDITFGQLLSESDLTGGTVKGSDNAELQGTWSWNDGTEQLNAGNDQERGVTFTPNDSHWYATATSTATVNVNKATPEEMANNVAVTYGTAASSVTLSGSGDGTWSWNDNRANQTDLAVNTYSLDVTFTPNDGDNYNVQNTTVQVTVNPATPDLAWTKAPTECLTTDANVTFAAASEKSTGAISYSIASGTGVSINANGVLTITAAGTVTIQATIAATQNYESRSITTSLTITPPNVFTNATGNGKWDDPANWSAVSVPEDDADVAISEDVTINEDVNVGKMTISDNVTITVASHLTISGTTEIAEDKYANVIVKDGGQLTVSNTFKVNDFSIEASQRTSGQVEFPEKLDIQGNAYIDITISTNPTLDEDQWYGFTVPFPVDAKTGVERILADGTVESGIVWNDNYMIASYDSQRRASGNKGWRAFSGVMTPGVFYLLGIDSQAKVYRFHKTATGNIAADDEMTLRSYPATGNGESGDANWNAVGNPTLRYSHASCPVDFVQIYDNNTGAYEPAYTANSTFVVGRPFFIQTGGGTLSISAADGTHGNYYAPRRSQEREMHPIGVLLEANDEICDKVYVRASEDATNTYVIGRDLQKMGTTTKKAQMWINALGKQLCVREETLNANTAKYELSIYAPEDGSYMLSIDETLAPENAMLYLTYNGRAIWNLTYSPYVFDLTKGTTEGYGLKMYVMQVTTDLEQSGFSDQNSVRKVLIDDVIYIVTPEGKMYDITGKSANY